MKAGLATFGFRVISMKTAVRALLVVVVITSLPTMFYCYWLCSAEIEVAKDRYERSLGHERRSAEDLKGVEERLVRMTTSVEAVEDEVREQHRLVRPGERLVLVEHERDGQETAALPGGG